MPNFEVAVSRTGCSIKTIQVEAATPEEAIKLALDKAGDEVFSEHTSTYDAESVVAL